MRFFWVITSTKLLRNNVTLLQSETEQEFWNLSNFSELEWWILLSLLKGFCPFTAASIAHVQIGRTKMLSSSSPKCSVIWNMRSFFSFSLVFTKILQIQYPILLEFVQEDWRYVGILMNYLITSLLFNWQLSMYGSVHKSVDCFIWYCLAVHVLGP